MKVCSVCRRCYDNFDTLCVDQTHPALSETHPGGREIVEGYSLDTQIESGLKGEVFQAHQLATNAPCIIRLIKTSEKERERTLREAKIAASIFHPNVADVYEAGSLDAGLVYVVAEYPAGQTLRELLDKVRVPELLTSIQILSQTAEALHTLHLNGLTHNAVRPENIILTTDADGYLLVRIQNIDHGGVGFRSIISNKFLIDSALDSLRYFAPEQCTGESAGPQTDVYSLGIVFYEMLAGAPPFDATSATALIHKQRNERPPDVRIDNFHLRMLLTHTLMESLQKQPAYRNASANAFARQMRHVEQLATHVSTPPPAGAVPETQSRPAPAIVAAPPPARSRPMPVVITVPEPTTGPDAVYFEESVSEPVPSVKPEPVSSVEAKPVVKPEPVPSVEAKPVVKPEPVLSVKPKPVVKPEPVLSVESKPVVKPEPVLSVEPKPAVEPELALSVEPKPIVKPEPILSVEPKSVAEPELVLSVEPEPVRQTVSLMDPIPDPLPIVKPEPLPEPVLLAEPAPVLQTASLTDSIPDPLPVVEAEPVKQAVASTDPIPDPLPAVKPEPIPAPALSLEPVMPAPAANIAESITPNKPLAVDLAREESNRLLRRSRMKVWKKKLHAMSAAIGQASQHEKAAFVADVPEISKVETPVESATVETPVEVPKVEKPVQTATVVEAPAPSPKTDIPIELTTLEMPLEMAAPEKPVETARVENVAPEAPPPAASLETRQQPPVNMPVRRKTAKRSAKAKAANAPSPDATVKRNTPRPSKVVSTTEPVAPDTISASIDSRSPVKPVAAPLAAKASLETPIAQGPATPLAAKASVETSIAERPATPLAAKASVETPIEERPAKPVEPVPMEPPRLIVEERVVRAAPKKIQWDQPDDDIPSEADVLDALAKDGFIDESEKYTGHVFTVTTPKSADGPIATAPRVTNPTPPVVAPKSADGPVGAGTVATNAGKAKPEKRGPAQPAAKTAAPRADAKTDQAIDRAAGRPAPPSVVDQEEITLVRPPRRIQVNLDQQAARNIYAGGWTPPRQRPDTDFFPTLLGEAEKPHHIQPPPSDAMFSTYYSAPVKKTAVPYRTVMFGGGVLVLIVTFLIGDGFVGDHVQSKNESVAQKTSAPRAKKVVPAINMKSSEQPREDAVVNEDEFKPLPDNDRLTRTIVEKPDAVTKTSAVRRDTPKSTTRDDTPAPRPAPRPAPAEPKKSGDTVQQTRAIGIKSAPAQTNPNIATRPRIVKDPK